MNCTKCMRIKEISIESRPRERMKKLGSHVLTDAEVLAIILQKGVKGENVIDMSNRLISRYGLEKLSECSIKELIDIKGIGEAKSLQIKAVFELSRRVRAGKICETVVNNSADVAKHYMAKLGDKKKEYFIAVFLDSKNKIICDKIISIGTLNASLVHPREVFKEAMKVSANSIILVHNHPSGDVCPSEEDIYQTKILYQSSKFLNIKIIDHIIITKQKYYSFHEKKWIFS